MPIEVVYDTVQDGEVQQSLLNGDRIVRTAFVKGLTSATTTSSFALFDALGSDPAMPLLGDAHPNQASALLMHRIARGIPNTGGQMARVWLHYERPSGGGSPIERFAAEDTITLVSESMGVFPGTATQLRCSLTSAAPNYTTDVLRATDRAITANFPATMRALILYGQFADRPSSNVKNAARKVNDAEWQGLGAGYWRCEGAKASYSSATGLYNVTCGFLNKGDGEGEDWSTYEIPRGPDGELAKVKDSVLQALYDQEYEYGPRNDINGVWKAGMYRTADFSAIFGDEFPIGD